MSVRIAWERRGAGAGAGAAVVLVHGLGYARWGWDPVAAELAERFSLILLDNRGIGESEVAPGPYTARMLAEDVVGVLDDAGVPRAHVIGTSLGGMVAQELALGWPGRVGRLVLVCTTPGGPRAPAYPEPTRRLLERAPSLEPAVALRLFVENALAPATVAERPELVERIYALRLANPPDPAGWAAQAAAAATFDAYDRLPGLDVPTLLVHGTEDRVVDVANVDVLAGLLRHARVSLVEGAGHLLFWERPGEFVASVAAFLEEA